MNKVLVTGATGFTGGRLAARLVDDGNAVVAFVRSGSDTGKLRALGVECREVDIRHQPEVSRNFTDFDQVYHVAAAYRSEHADHEEFRLVNVEGTRNLLESARQFDVKRFVHCSTVGVQGEIEEPPATETYRLKPGDHYQQSKLDGERVAVEYARSGLPVTVIRPVGIYGPGDTRFLKLFRAIQRRRFVMIGTGEVLYHMTFVDDLVDGFLLAGSNPEAIGEVFTIAGPRYTTLRELVDSIAEVLERKPPRLRIPYQPVYMASVVCDKICRAVNVSPPLYPRRVEFFSLDRAFSTDKARSVLGFVPKVDLKEGLKLTADWYREQGLI